MALTLKQKAFVAEYLVDPNATKAATRAGFKQPHSQGPRLLKIPAIAAAIAAGKARHFAKLEITAESILRNIVEVVDESKSCGDRGNALRGLELLGKHQRLFTEKLEVTGRVTLEQLVTGSYDQGDGNG